MDVWKQFTYGIQTGCRQSSGCTYSCRHSIYSLQGVFRVYRQLQEVSKQSADRLQVYILLQTACIQYADSLQGLYTVSNRLYTVCENSSGSTYSLRQPVFSMQTVFRVYIQLRTVSIQYEDSLRGLYTDCLQLLYCLYTDRLYTGSTYSFREPVFSMQIVFRVYIQLGTASIQYADRLQGLHTVRGSLYTDCQQKVFRAYIQLKKSVYNLQTVLRVYIQLHTVCIQSPDSVCTVCRQSSGSTFSCRQSTYSLQTDFRVYTLLQTVSIQSSDRLQCLNAVVDSLYTVCRQYSGSIYSFKESAYLSLIHI